MHHYTECGLTYVYLENGFHIETVDGEEFVGIEAVDSLHQIIGETLSEKHSTLTGQEIRFLRVEMNLSQKGLGDLLGVEDQTVARWEKEQTPIPRTAEVTLRSMYLEYIDRESHVSHLLMVLAEAEEKAGIEQLKLREEADQWQLSA